MGRARKLIRRFRKDRLFHDRVRLRVGTAFNLSYALVKFALAGQEGSIWMASVALYYTAVTFVLLYLVRADLRLGAADAPGANQAHWRVAGRAGWMLGSLVLTLSGMGVLVVRDGAAPAYPGHLIFGMAAFAFYSVGMAIARFVRGHHGLGPLFTAAKCVDLSVATVSLYALQTALIGLPLKNSQIR